MANTAKIYTDGDGFLLVTNTGNYTITDNQVKKTTRTGEGLTETAFDYLVQIKLDNAKSAMQGVLGVDAIEALGFGILEKSEDFD